MIESLFYYIMIFTSEIVKCNVPNKNGHVYTKECIEKALENPVIKERLENGCFFGGFMEDYKNDFEIDISKVSHVCKELWWEDNTLYGKFETLNTPKGMTLTEMLNTWTKNSSDCMATSGNGTLEIDTDGNQVVKDYTLLSINFTEEKA